ncbi:Oxygen sensor protein DosP [compost metagenome]
MVAEGVETPEQMDLLRSFDCDQVQGYLISRPLPMDELMEYLLRGPAQQSVAL